ncbi:hypothetical protein G3I43_29495, partial [Streptomyces anulatus]|nr:hypothetical protein [Streptomyces anulatus]
MPESSGLGRSGLEKSVLEKPPSPRRELQRAGQIHPPLPRPETRLVGDRAPLPQHRKHLGRQPRAPEVP